MARRLDRQLLRMSYSFTLLRVFIFVTLHDHLLIFITFLWYSDLDLLVLAPLRLQFDQGIHAHVEIQTVKELVLFYQLLVWFLFRLDDLLFESGGSLKCPRIL